MFGGNSFPLGPNGRFPKQRIRSAGNELIAAEDMEGVYLSSGVAKVPVRERDYHSSIAKVKDKLKDGNPHKHARMYKDIDRFRPRYAPPSSLRHALGDLEQRDIDELNTLGGRSMRQIMKSKRFR